MKFFKGAKEYLSAIRYYIIFSALIFFFAAYFGYTLIENSPEQAKNILEEFRKISEPIKNIAPLELFLFIFLKNSVAVLIAILFGAVLGLAPFFAVFANGIILGVFAYAFLQKFSLPIFLAGILPHGVIEIPVLFFAAASGFRLWRAAFRRIVFNEKKFSQEFSRAMNFFFNTLLPLLLIAAFIETFVTSRFLALLSR
ncbi:stage II sporulation protein M [Patescibacteria group bacterium]|nr:stage II sporulation protein M [Patescibacteria group bacterium]MBU3999653.1 stage II sporulation protein M [Patescibacteria group bacterium]MBU4057168.1 stage II sporulation protein M [Patescibacteria group bacterium]MBU4368998.1 stage II sporulation protein M [Patescibacteria group bacterium]